MKATFSMTSSFWSGVELDATLVVETSKQMQVGISVEPTTGTETGVEVDSEVVPGSLVVEGGRVNTVVEGASVVVGGIVVVRMVVVGGRVVVCTVVVGRIVVEVGS